MNTYNDFLTKKAEFAFIVPDANSIDSYLACAAVLNSMDAEIIGLIESQAENVIIEKKIADSIVYANQAIKQF